MADANRMAAAPEERWDLADVAVGDRDEVWRAIVSATHLPWTLDVVRDDPAPGTGEVVRRRWGDLDVVEVRCGPCGGRRLRSDIRRTTGDYVGVLIIRSGCEVVEQDDEQVRLEAGDVLTWRSDRPVRFDVLEPLHKATILVPEQRLREVVRRSDVAAMRRVPATAARHLFTSYLDLVSGLGPDPRVAPVAGTAALELLGAALAHTSPAPVDRAGHAALHARATTFIDDHLADADLTPQRIAAQQGVSERLLYSVFEEQGDSVSAYVRRRRLARAHADLQRFDRAVTVREIARRWGFDDPAHFTRAFVAAYGVAPSRLRPQDAGAD